MKHSNDGCWACGKECNHDRGIPVFEDVILPNDYKGEWFGVDACQECFDKQAALQKPVHIFRFKKMTLSSIAAQCAKAIDWTLPDAVMRRAKQIQQNNGILLT